MGPLITQDIQQRRGSPSCQGKLRQVYYVIRHPLGKTSCKLLQNRGVLKRVNFYSLENYIKIKKAITLLWRKKNKQILSGILVVFIINQLKVEVQTPTNIMRNKKAGDRQRKGKGPLFAILLQSMYV